MQKRLIIAVIFALFMINSFSKAFGDDEKTKEPFTAMNISLGESESSIKKKFKDKNIKLILERPDYLIYDKDLTDAGCDEFEVDFYDGHVADFMCFLKADSNYDYVEDFYTNRALLVDKYGKCSDRSRIPDYASEAVDDPNTLSGLILLDMSSLSCFWRLTRGDDTATIRISLSGFKPNEDSLPEMLFVIMYVDPVLNELRQEKEDREKQKNF